MGFLFLVALGVDYTIFLMTRAREEAQKHGHRDGILTSLAVTGGVITSAGIVLAATFAVLAVPARRLLASTGRPRRRRRHPRHLPRPQHPRLRPRRGHRTTTLVARPAVRPRRPRPNRHRANTSPCCAEPMRAEHDSPRP